MSTDLKLITLFVFISCVLFTTTAPSRAQITPVVQLPWESLEQADSQDADVLEALELFARADHGAFITRVDRLGASTPPSSPGLAELQVKQAYSLLAAGNSSRASAILRRISAQNAGMPVGKQAYQSLERLHTIVRASPRDQKHLIDAAYAIESGDWKSAAERLSTAIDQSSDLGVSDFARSELAHVQVRLSENGAQADAAIAQAGRISSPGLQLRAIAMHTEQVLSSGTPAQQTQAVARVRQTLSSGPLAGELSRAAQVRRELLLATMAIHEGSIADLQTHPETAKIEAARAGLQHLTQSYDLITNDPDADDLLVRQLLPQAVTLSLMSSIVPDDFKKADEWMAELLSKYGEQDALAAQLAILAIVYNQIGADDQTARWVTELLVRYPYAPESHYLRESLGRYVLQIIDVDEAIRDGVTAPDELFDRHAQASPDGGTRVVLGSEGNPAERLDEDNLRATASATHSEIENGSLGGSFLAAANQPAIIGLLCAILVLGGFGAVALNRYRKRP